MIPLQFILKLKDLGLGLLRWIKNGQVFLEFWYIIHLDWPKFNPTTFISKSLKKIQMAIVVIKPMKNLNLSHQQNLFHTC
jgi:hypothetical protein